MPIYIDFEAAKQCSHRARREIRQNELAPLDEKVNHYFANPEKLAELEAQRQEIRDKYAVMQNEIDAAETIQHLKDALKLDEAKAKGLIPK
jgi:hypothetical protein